MAYRDLRDFIHKLEKEGELTRIGRSGPGAGNHRDYRPCRKAGGPALLFERPKGSRIPVVTILSAPSGRMNMALEVDSLEDVAARISSFLDMQSPQGLLEKVKMLPKLAELGSFFPKTVRSGACQEVVRTDNFSLEAFPILKCWPQDGGRYITWPMVITKNPETGKRNVGCYRMQVYDERTTGMHWQTQKHGAEHFRSARAKNPRRQNGSRGSHRRGPCHAPRRDSSRPAGHGRVHVFRLPAQGRGGIGACETVDLEVPANAEIVLEGYVKSGRDANRRAIRRPHRLLLAGRASFPSFT